MFCVFLPSAEALGYRTKPAQTRLVAEALGYNESSEDTIPK
jgi:hypothetical protein